MKAYFKKRKRFLIWNKFVWVAHLDSLEIRPSSHNQIFEQYKKKYPNTQIELVTTGALSFWDSHLYITFKNEADEALFILQEIP